MGEEVVVRSACLPVHDGSEMAGAFRAYRDLQDQLDKAMPEQLTQIQGKPFRKKGYWRAVKTAFSLTLELIEERREEFDGDWGYLVTYRAKTPTGVFADGDGSCFASEKSKGRMEATVHNVRSHAHTRAKNRAISDLVGFGEVSAEEINRDEETRKEGARDFPLEKESRKPFKDGDYDASGDTRPATEAQGKRLFAKSKAIEASTDEMKAFLKKATGVESSKGLNREQIDKVFKLMEGFEAEKEYAYEAFRAWME